MRFLLIEDNKVTILSIQKIINKELPTVIMDIAENGKEALDYLEKCRDIDLPYFILLDLNMPVMNGKEFLGILRENQKYSTIPVVIHSTSANHEDYDHCNSLGISGYFVKHVNFKAFSDMLLLILNYWTASLKK